MKSLSHVQLSATPWTAAYQAPLSMGFSRQEYWSGVPLPSPRTTLELLNHVGAETERLSLMLRIIILMCVLLYVPLQLLWLLPLVQPDYHPTSRLPAGDTACRPLRAPTVEVGARRSVSGGHQENMTASSPMSWTPVIRGSSLPSFVLGMYVLPTATKWGPFQGQSLERAVCC